MTSSDPVLPPGAPAGDALEQELEPLLAEDHSVWTYDAEVGGYTCPTHHEGVVCRTASAVAAHVNGPNKTVRQFHGKEPR